MTILCQLKQSERSDQERKGATLLLFMTDCLLDTLLTQYLLSLMTEFFPI